MKTKLGARMGLYPLPVILLGSNIKGKPNYTTIAHVGILDYDHISLSVAKIHFTNKVVFSEYTIQEIDKTNSSEYSANYTKNQKSYRFK